MNPLRKVYVWYVLLAGFWVLTAVAWADGVGRQKETPMKTDIGIWYCTYYQTKPTDIWDEKYGTTTVKYRPLCSNKPGDFRKYDADDPAVIDFHLEQLADAKIDFILLECTPGGLGGYRPATKHIVDKARVVCERIKAWNDDPRHAWKIRYAIAAGCHPDVWDNKPGFPVGLCMEDTAQDVSNTFVNNPAFGGAANYYHLNGQPILVFWGYGDPVSNHWANYKGTKTSGNRFALRTASGCRAGEYGWNIPGSGTVLHQEVEVVSPGWGHYARAEPPYVARRKGDFYRECWKKVLGNPLPRIVMIVAFNDYWENTAVWTADTANLTDADKWEDAGGKLNPSMYWEMTKDYISQLRKAELAAGTPD